MKTTELQKLVNECICIEDIKQLNFKFDANIKEAQNELDANQSKKTNRHETITDYFRQKH